MLRWAFNILAAVSLALFLAVVVLWVRSYYVEGEVLSYANPSDATNRWVLEATESQGEVYLLILRETSGTTPGGGGFSYSSRPANYVFPIAGWLAGAYCHTDFMSWALSHNLNVTGMTGTAFDAGTTASLRGVTRSHGAIVLLLMVCPCLWLLGWWLRRRRKTAGLCRACGYDLRASTGSCPECGAAIPDSNPTTGTA